MDISNSFLPICYRPEVVIKDGQIKRAVTVCPPWKVYVRSASNINHLRWSVPATTVAPTLLTLMPMPCR